MIPLLAAQQARAREVLPAEVLDALRSYQGAVVLVTHDPGAAEALDP